MSSKRFKKLPKGTSSFSPQTIGKLLPEVKKNCTTKFNESIDLSLQINNKQKKKYNKFKNSYQSSLRNRQKN